MGVGVVAFKWAQILYSPPSMKWGLVLHYYYFFFYFKERERAQVGEGAKGEGKADSLLIPGP